MRALIAVLSILLLAPAAARAQFGDQVSFKLVHISDTQEMEGDWGRGGLAAVSGLVEDLYATADLVVLTHGGGAISPSLLSYFDRGEHMIDLLNRSGVMVMGLSNSEFNFGPDILEERVAEARFPVLGSNARLPGGRRLQGVRDSWILEYKGYKIGFYGLIDPQTSEISSPGDTVFLDPVQTAAIQAASLRQDGADLVVGLLNLRERYYGPIMEAGHSDLLLGNTGVDLLVWKRDGRLYLRVPPGAKETAVVTVKLSRQAVEIVPEDEAEGTLLDLDGNANPEELEGALELLLQPTEVRFDLAYELEVESRSLLDYEPDPVMFAAIQYYHFNVPRQISRPVAELAAPLETDEGEVRSHETAFGNMVADALREAAGADIGIVNAGYIHGDRVYEAGDILTWRTLVEELPFPNQVTGLELKGKVIKRFLENAVSRYEQSSGRFLQVSGLEVRYDILRPVGERVVSVTLQGEELNPERVYRIALPEFLANGGDGYDMFAFARRYAHEAEDKFVLEVLSDYLSLRSPIEPRVEGRISFVN
jgi:2',3'-cyclic-nucleotide 2'-phosphodiesterase (5'-nucleotidase family)